MAQRKNTRRAILADGRQIQKLPDEPMKTYSVMLPPSLVEAVREYAKRRGNSLASAVRDGLVLYAEKAGLV